MSSTSSATETDCWAAEIAGLADFNDARLNDHYASLLATFASQPLADIPPACVLLHTAERPIETLPEAERPRLIQVMDREGDIQEVLEHITRRRNSLG